VTKVSGDIKMEIEEITMRGEVYVEFSEELAVPTNLSMMSNGNLPALAFIVHQSSGSKDDLVASFHVFEFTERGMKLELQWADPIIISSNGVRINL